MTDIAISSGDKTVSPSSNAAAAAVDDAPFSRSRASSGAEGGDNGPAVT